MVPAEFQGLAPPRLARYWPLVGRVEELRFTVQSITPPRRGLVLVGGAGVGKTRLAKEAAAEAERGGRIVVPIAATEAPRDMPMGALGPVFGRDLPTSRGASVAIRVPDVLRTENGDF